MEDHVDHVVTQYLIPEGLPGHRVQQQVHGVVVHDRGGGVAERLEQGEDGLEAQLVDEGVGRHVVVVVRDEGAGERRPVDRERRPEKGDEQHHIAPGGETGDALRRVGLASRIRGSACDGRPPPRRRPSRD
jgi:hypothetical protein